MNAAIHPSEDESRTPEKAPFADFNSQAAIAVLERLASLSASEIPNSNILSEIAALANEAINAEIVFIRALADDTNSFIVKAVSGPPALALSGLLGTYTPVTETLQTATLSDNLVIDLSRDDVEPALTTNEGWTLRQLGVHNLLVFPLFVSGQLVGRIDFARTHRRAFEPIEITFGRLIGAHAASVLNARRLEAMSEETNVYRTVIGLHQKIEQLADPRSILQAVVELVLREPGCERSYAMLWNAEREEFVPTAVAGLDPHLVEMLKLITLSPQLVPAFDRMMHSSRPLIVDDARTSTLLPQSLVRALGIKTALIVPLRGRHHQTIGFILLDHGSDLIPFDEHDVSVMEGIASHLSTMIENAILYDQAVESSDSLSVINDIGVQLAMLNDEESLFRQLHHQISAVIDATFFALGLLTDEHQEINIRAAVDGVYQQSQIRMAPGQDILSRTIATGKSIVFGTRDTNNPDQWATNIEGFQNCHSQLTVPIRVGRNVIGAMSVQSPFRHAYGPRERTLLTAIALQTGVALENARLYRLIQERGDRRALVLDEVLQRHESERKELVEDIHDNTLQALAACLYSLDLAQDFVHDDAQRDKLAAAIASTRDTISENIDRLRKRIFQIRPATLDMLGLEPALREFLSAIEEDYGLRTSLEMKLPTRLNADLETSIYRLIQEAISPILVTQDSGGVSVKIRITGSNVVMTIHDSLQPGVSTSKFDAAEDQRDQVGMLALVERAELAGGSIRVARTVGGGSSMQISLPRIANELAADVPSERQSNTTSAAHHDGTGW